MKCKLIHFVAVLMILSLFLACAEMQQVLQMANIQKPTAKVSDVKISQISFKDIGLMFDISIQNPNSISIRMDGFDYDLLLAGSSFVKGDQSEGVEIVSQGSSVVSLPVTLTFKEIYDVFKSMKDKDEIGYELRTGLKFDLPVLGLTRIPVETRGTFPAVKIPSVKLSSISLKKTGLTSVDLEAVLQINNPNNFGLNMDKFNYALNINGEKWVSGIKSTTITLNQKGNSDIRVPVSLNILNVGRSVINMINNGTQLDYNLSGSAEMGSTLPMFGAQPLNFNKSGQVSIIK